MGAWLLYGLRRCRIDGVKMILKELAKLLSDDCYCRVSEVEKSYVIYNGHLKDITDNSILYSEVVDFYSSEGGENKAFIRVARRRNEHTLKEVLNFLDPFEHVDVFVIYDDGSKTKIVTDGLAGIMDERYEDYFVQKIRLVPSKYRYMVVEIDVKLSNE